MKYTLGSSAPSYIFHNQHKTLNNLYLSSPCSCNKYLCFWWPDRPCLPTPNPKTFFTIFLKFLFFVLFCAFLYVVILTPPLCAQHDYHANSHNTLFIKVGNRPVNMHIVCLFVCFVALRPKSTAMVIAGQSVHLTTLFSWASLNKHLTSTSCTYFRL